MTYMCVFRVADLLLALPVSEVQQVVHGPTIHPLPQTPPSVLGLVNLRGRVVTAVRARPLFHLDGDGDEKVHLVMLQDGSPLSLVVDEVLEVVEVDLDEMRQVPAHLPDRIRQAAVGVVCREDDLVLVIGSGQVVRALREAA